MKLEERKINHAGRPVGPVWSFLPVPVPVREKPDRLQLCIEPFSNTACPRNVTLRWSSFEKKIFLVEQIWMGH